MTEYVYMSPGEARQHRCFGCGIQMDATRRLPYLMADGSMVHVDEAGAECGPVKRKEDATLFDYLHQARQDAERIINDAAERMQAPTTAKPDDQIADKPRLDTWVREAWMAETLATIEPRRFQLQSNTIAGALADGVVFRDGHIALRWLVGAVRTELWPPDSIGAIANVYGHEVVWMDPV